QSGSPHGRIVTSRGEVNASTARVRHDLPVYPALSRQPLRRADRWLTELICRSLTRRWYGSPLIPGSPRGATRFASASGAYRPEAARVERGERVAARWATAR